MNKEESAKRLERMSSIDLNPELKIHTEEKQLLERVLEEHRRIMSKSGYGRIFINYTKEQIEVVAESPNRLVIKKENY